MTRSLHAQARGGGSSRGPIRVLFVSHHYPSDVSRSASGAFHRMRTWLDAIQSIGADLEMLFLPDTSLDGALESERMTRFLAEQWGLRARVVVAGLEPPARLGLIERYLAPAMSLSRWPEFAVGTEQRQALAEGLAREPDVVFFHSLHSIVKAFAHPLGGARVLLDLPDIEHLKFTRELAQPPHRPLKPLRGFWLPAFWWGERTAIQRADRAFVCSEADRRYLRRTMAVRNVDVIPNAVPREPDGGVALEPNVLFLGTYGYPPNVVAAEHLIRVVWPRVLALMPEARLRIVGSRPERIPSFKDQPQGVEFTGFVVDLEPVFRTTRVMCTPIRSGGGTRIKILEAASYGVPVVSTSMGAEGIEFAPDREIVLRDDPDDLARACVDLLRDHERAERIGREARDRVRALYSRETVITRMAEMLGASSATPVRTPLAVEATPREEP